MIIGIPDTKELLNGAIARDVKDAFCAWASPAIRDLLWPGLVVNLQFQPQGARFEGTKDPRITGFTYDIVLYMRRRTPEGYGREIVKTHLRAWGSIGYDKGKYIRTETFCNMKNETVLDAGGGDVGFRYTLTEMMSELVVMEAPAEKKAEAAKRKR